MPGVQPASSRKSIAPAILLAGAFACITAGGCARLPAIDADLPAETPQWATACREDFITFDARIDDAGVADVQAAQVPTRPYLRSNRALAALGRSLPVDRRPAWVRLLAELDAAARRIEAANYPPESTAPLPALARLDECRERLVEDLLARPDALAGLAAAARPDPAYDFWQRWVGLYPLTAVPVRLGVRRLHAAEARYFERPPASWHPTGAWEVYAPSPPPPLKTADGIPRDALGLPAYTAAELAALFAEHAPIWKVAQAGPADRLGAPTWLHGDRLAVDTGRPAMYTHLSLTRIQGHWLPQLNYVVWFPARRRAGPLDVTAGLLDGLTWRVTLGRDGTPLVYDAMHNCGCYHMFFPPPGWRVRDDAPGEPVWVPAGRPAPAPGERVVLYLEAGSHYLRRVATSPPPAHSTPLPLAGYDRLRSLPTHGDGRRSLFDRRGLVAESRRPERWLLWPMGVPSAGAIRQFGHHATAFIGTRHFDDPALFHTLFHLDPGELP